jgi:hypothetical protein
MDKIEYRAVIKFFVKEGKRRNKCISLKGDYVERLK